MYRVTTSLSGQRCNSSYSKHQALVKRWGLETPWLTQATQLNYPTGLNPQTPAQSLHKRVNFFILHLAVYYKVYCKGKIIQLQVTVDQKVFKLQQEPEDYQYSQICVPHLVTIRTYYEGEWIHRPWSAWEPYHVFTSNITCVPSSLKSNCVTAA